MKIAVIGAGIIGLELAYELAKKGAEVSLFEKESYLGGLCSCFNMNGKRLEKYYHHFFINDTHLIGLLKELGLQDKLSWQESRMGLYYGGKTYGFGSPHDLLRFKPFGFIDKARFALSTFYLQKFANWKKLQNTPAAWWLNKYAGEKVYKIIWEPLLQTKFGREHEQISAAWFCSRIKLRGSTKVNAFEKESLGYLHGGLEVLIDALRKNMADKSAKVYLNTKIDRIKGKPDGSVDISSNGNIFNFDKVVFTGAPSLFASMVVDIDERYKESLNEIEYRAVCCLVLELKEGLSDFYWLNIADSGIPFGGIMEHTNLIGAKNYGDSHIAYISNYLSVEDREYRMNETELMDEYEKNLKRVIPDFDKSSIKTAHLFKYDFAQPIVEIGYQDKLLPHKTPVKNVYLSNMSQIYPEDRGVNMSVKLSKETADYVLKDAGAA